MPSFRKGHPCCWRNTARNRPFSSLSPCQVSNAHLCQSYIHPILILSTFASTPHQFYSDLHTSSNLQWLISLSFHMFLEHEKKPCCQRVYVQPSDNNTLDRDWTWVFGALRLWFYNVTLPDVRNQGTYYPDFTSDLAETLFQPGGDRIMLIVGLPDIRWGYL